MEYRKLGNSDLKASEIGLGGDTFGEHVDEQGTKTLVDHAIESGINFIDTSDVYGHGHSEELLGNALKGKRNKVIIATKFGIALGKPPQPFDTPPGLGSRKHVMKSVDASLKRLKTDYIDLYQFHMPDPVTPIEETLRAMNELVCSGKVRYIGCSNFASWELCEALWVSKTAGINSFVSVQPKYNLLDRYIEQELVPCCTAYNISVIPWFPLAAGFLTGKYKRGVTPPPDTRFGHSPGFYSHIPDSEFDILDKLQAFARERGHIMAELAIAWLVSHPWLGPLIAGATRTEQITANVKAASWKLTADEMKKLDQAYGFQMYSLRPEIYRRWPLQSGYR